MKRFFSLILLLLAVTIMLCSCDLVNDFIKGEPNESDEATSGLLYELRDDGTYRVSAGSARGETNIVIPAYFQGVAITEIADSGFSGAIYLKSIKIPDSVTVISDYAFYNCYELEGIDLPKNVESIGSYAFKGCSKLSSITIPNSLKVIKSYAFLDSSTTKDIYITDLTSWCQIDFGDVLGGNLYLNGELLTHLVIPNGITEIKPYSFYGCQSLKSVVIPECVASIGDCSFYGCTNLKSIDFPRNMTSIGRQAFYACYSLVSVEIPDGITSLVSGQFSGCASLVSITIPSSVTNAYFLSITGGKLVEIVNNASAEIFEDQYCPGSMYPEIHNGESKIVYQDDYIFYTRDGVNYLLGYTGEKNRLVLPESYNGQRYEIIDGAFSCNISLTSVVIPDTVTYLSGGMFYSCSSLTDIVIPNSVTEIRSGAFDGCASLTSINIPVGITKIGGRAYANCPALERIYINDISAWCAIEFFDAVANPMSQGAELYVNGELVRNLVIPDGVTAIRDYVFYNASFITDFIIPDSVTYIGNYAFSNCSSIAEISIPDSVTKIGDYALSGCSLLTKIVIPDNVTEIGCGVFSQCNSLTTLTVPYANGADYSMGFSSGLKQWFGDDYYSPLPDSLTTVVVTGGETIPECAFFGCDKLTKIVIPDSVTRIERGAFSNCRSITEIEIPDGVISIGENAFSFCTSLTNIVLPDSIIEILSFAFCECASLENVYYAGTENQWNAIFIDEYNEYLHRAKKYYNLI